MITNKDVRVENGNLVLNGDKYPLDGQSPEAIMQIVEDNSDTTPTKDSTAPVTSGGIKTAIEAQVSVYTMPDQSVTVTGPYTDVTFTKPVEEGYTFYLLNAIAFTYDGWNISNIRAESGTARIYTSVNTAKTANVSTAWLKVKNS